MKTINPIEYLAHVWKPAGEDGAYPLNPKRGNEIEKGISDAADRINLIIPELTVIDEEPSLLMTGNYPGRKIDDITEIQAELDAAGSVAAFLNARAKAHNTKFLRIGDYTDIAQSGFGTRRHGLFAFDPYYNAGATGKGGHFVMGSMEGWPVAVQWNTTNDNNGSASQQFPYLNSNLHKYELQTILPSYPVEWQNVMLSNQVLLEKRYSASGKLSASNGWDWADLGKIWSPSETEVYGQCVWATPGYSVGYDCQFPFFRQTRNRIMLQGGNRVGWWLRSVGGASSTNACGAGGSGEAGSGSTSGAGIRCLPCFLIGA